MEFKKILNLLTLQLAKEEATLKLRFGDPGLLSNGELTSIYSTSESLPPSLSLSLFQSLSLAHTLTYTQR